MNVVFNPGDLRQIREFFRFDIDFLDMYIMPSAVMLIAHNAELYSQMNFKVLERDNVEEPVCFRVERKMFLSLLCEGTVGVYIGTRDNVELTFTSSTGNSYKMQQPFQMSDIASINARLQILKEKDKFVPLKFRNIEPAMRLLRDVSPVISVVDGMVVVNKNDMQVYYKADCENITISTLVAGYLLKFGETIYGFQNFVIAEDKRTVIIARKSKDYLTSDFDYVVGKNSTQKTTHKLKVDFTPICDLVRRCKDSESIVVDFERSLAFIEQKRYKYSVKFKVDSVESIHSKRAEEGDIEGMFKALEMRGSTSLTSIHNIPTLQFPVELVSKVLSVLNMAKLTIRIKRKLVVMEVNSKFFIVVGRRDLD